MVLRAGHLLEGVEGRPPRQQVDVCRPHPRKHGASKTVRGVAGMKLSAAGSIGSSKPTSRSAPMTTTGVRIVARLILDGLREQRTNARTPFRDQGDLASACAQDLRNSSSGTFRHVVAGAQQIDDREAGLGNRRAGPDRPPPTAGCRPQEPRRRRRPRAAGGCRASTPARCCRSARIIICRPRDPRRSRLCTFARRALGAPACSSLLRAASAPAAPSKTRAGRRAPTTAATASRRSRSASSSSSRATFVRRLPSS